MKIKELLSGKIHYKALYEDINTFYNTIKQRDYSEKEILQKIGSEDVVEFVSYCKYFGNDKKAIEITKKILSESNNIHIVRHAYLRMS